MRCLLFVCLVIVAGSCSTKTRQLFFDIPPPRPQELAEQARLQAELEAANIPEAEEETSTPPMLGLYDESQPRPEIETLSNWEDVLEALPKDYKKKADWSAAIEQGIVRPRPGADPRTLLATAFQYDFIIETEKPKNEGYFPHSAHTQWLGCKNCHASIYPYKRNPASMKEMRAGASCGVCHGKNNVAFSLSQCKRCHLKR